MESEDQIEEGGEPIPEVVPPGHPAFQDAFKARTEADSQQAMAVAEERLWQMADVDARRQYKRHVWLAAIVKTGAFYEIAMRGRLIHAPQVLWDRVDDPDEPMPLSTAVRIMKDARQKAGKSGHSLAGCVDDELADYDKLPVFHTAEGKKFRRRTGVHIIREKTSSKEMGSAQGRGWWARMRQVIGNLVADKVPAGVDEVAREDLYKWLDKEIRTVIDQFSAQAAKLPRRGQPAVEINRKQLVAACRTLHIDPPPPGGKADLARATQAKRSFARAYHPDGHGGDETMRELYEGIIQAYAVVEAYAKKHGATTKPTGKRGPSHEQRSGTGTGGEEDDDPA